MENTKNLGLKKWEGGDRILHSEFNDNWDKIDAALAERLGAMETLLDYEYTGDPVWSIDAPLPEGMDWSRYSIVALEAAPVANSRSGACSVALYNGNTAVWSGTAMTDNNLPKSMAFWFTGRQDAGGTFAAELPSGGVQRVESPLGSATTVKVTGSQLKSTYVCKGTRLSLWGIR